MFIVENEPRSIAAESYRTLRTNIQYSSFDKEYRTIVITSSEPGEGKSTTSGKMCIRDRYSASAFATNRMDINSMQQIVVNVVKGALI